MDKETIIMLECTYNWSTAPSAMRIRSPVTEGTVGYNFNQIDKQCLKYSCWLHGENNKIS